MIPVIVALLTVPSSGNGAGGGLAFDLNSIISGGTGAGLVALAIFIVKLVLDRTVPSRSDARANVSLVLEGLSNMVKVLQEEKLADSKRLSEKQARIDVLENDDIKNYDIIRELRKEISDLESRLALRDRHLQTLVMELRKFGVEIIGISVEDVKETLEIRIQKTTTVSNVPVTTGEIPRVRE